MAATKETTQIELPPLNLEIIEVTLIGDTPLISHVWSEKAKREMLGKQMKVAKPAKEAKDPHEDFHKAFIVLKAVAMASRLSRSRLRR